MHYGVLAIVDKDTDINYFLEKFYYDYDGDEIEIEEEFVMEMSHEEAEKTWEEETRGEKRKKLYPNISELIKVCKMNLEEYMQYAHHYEKNPYGKGFGFISKSNPLGMYDWYDIGGRWDNVLVTKANRNCNVANLSEVDWEKTFDQHSNTKCLFSNIIDEDGNNFDISSNKELLSYIRNYTGKRWKVYVIDMHT